jgi:predicted GNAT family N-acyltransferase
MFVVQRFSFQDKILAKQAFGIRYEVFVKEQGIDAALEYDHEEVAHHYLLFMNDKPVATARWRETEKGIKLERFAVLPSFRNQGVSTILLKEVLQDVASVGRIIYLHAQLTAVKFYERNGFSKRGGQFSEAGVDQFMMKYQSP